LAHLNVSIVFTILNSSVTFAADYTLSVSGFEVCVIEKQCNQLLAFDTPFRLSPSLDGSGGVLDTCDHVSKIVAILGHFHFDR
jgi:hypothetical protein